MRFLVFVSALVGAVAVRKKRKSASREQREEDWPWPTEWPTWGPGGWSTSSKRSPCADHFTGFSYSQRPRPVGLQVICVDGHVESDELTLKINVKYGGGPVEVSVDGTSKGSQNLGFGWGSWVIGTLSQGTHSITVLAGSGERRVGIDEVTLEGSSGNGCSFDTSPNFERQAPDSYTYGGFDVLNRLFGSAANFSELNKKQLHFVSETAGRTNDGRIDAGVVGEGIWRWFFEYSQVQADDDKWGSKTMNYEESKLERLPPLELGYLRGRSGQKMVVIEPCNTLSNLAFDQAAVWIACKAYPFGQDELASLVAGFSAIAAGSSFMHGSGTNVGWRADTFPMDWHMLQTYQTMMKQVVSRAGDRLTPEERTYILDFNTSAGLATDLAKDVTSLFGQKYNHTEWKTRMLQINDAIPSYFMPIVGVISSVVWLIQESSLPDWAGTLLEEVLKMLMGTFDVPNTEFLTDHYFPAVRKAFSITTVCKDAIWPVLENTLNFIATFVTALLFQEEIIKDPPKEIQDVLKKLDELGFTNHLSDMVDSWDYYNGAKKTCEERSNHVTWHEKAAHGLVHMLNTASYFRSHLGEPGC